MEKDYQTIHTSAFDFRWTSGFEPLPMRLHGFNPHYRSGLLGCKAGDFNLDLVHCEGHWAMWMLSDLKALLNESRHYHGCMSLTPEMTPFLWPQMREMLGRAGYQPEIVGAFKEPKKAPWMILVEPVYSGEKLNDNILSGVIRSCSARLAFFLSNGRFRPV
ncbi:hypothetical protein QQ054_32550 [Oscillatoria amoena NRMC-F 0135]|nr:hypothetical protein [Oscillatoria amoena NRMC-F 0135]